MSRHIKAFIYQEDDGTEIRIDTENLDGEFDTPPLEQLKGILHAIRWMMETPEGGSVLDQCVTIVRRVQMCWPDFKRLNALQYLEGGQVCRTYAGGGEVLWWNLSRRNHPTLREALDKLIKLSETDHVTVETHTGRIPSTIPGRIEHLPAGTHGERKYSDGVDTSIPQRPDEGEAGTDQTEVRPK